jgi:hypothetical protein
MLHAAAIDDTKMLTSLIKLTHAALFSEAFGEKRRNGAVLCEGGRKGELQAAMARTR